MGGRESQAWGTAWAKARDETRVLLKSKFPAFRVFRTKSRKSDF